MKILRAIVLGAVLSVLVASVAAAATLATRTQTVAGGTNPVTACGGLSAAVVNYTVTAGNVTQLVISNLPSACNGGQLWATLTLSGVDVGHGGPATISGGVATVTGLSGAPATGGVSDVRIAVSGP